MGNWENHYIQEVKNLPSSILQEELEGFCPRRVKDFQSHKAQWKEIHLELGSGSGMHLINLAARNPDALCIGVELRYKRAFRTVEKAHLQGLTNLFMIRGKAQNALKLFSTRELSGLYLHFPDPWEKKRQQKHRLLQEPLLSELLLKLSSNGTFSFRTDHQEYYHASREFFAAHMKELSPKIKLLWETEDLFNSPFSPEQPTSEFESLFVSLQKPIGALVAQRI